MRCFTCHKPCCPKCALVERAQSSTSAAPPGRYTAPGAGAYHITKYGVEALSLSLRAEVAQFGVRVRVAIEPTGVRTPFVEGHLKKQRSYAHDDPYAGFKRRHDEAIAALVKTPGLMISADTVARVVLRVHRRQEPQASLHRWVVWKSHHTGARAADRPDVGAHRVVRLKP